jgi:hypothetical protein
MPALSSSPRPLTVSACGAQLWRRRARQAAGAHVVCACRMRLLPSSCSMAWHGMACACTHQRARTRTNTHPHLPIRTRTRTTHRPQNPAAQHRAGAQE